MMKPKISKCCRCGYPARLRQHEEFDWQTVWVREVSEGQVVLRPYEMRSKAAQPYYVQCKGPNCRTRCNSYSTKVGAIEAWNNFMRLLSGIRDKGERDEY